MLCQPIPPCQHTLQSLPHGPESAACVPQVYVSYLEIYNDAGYDLLDPARNIHGFEDLPRVSVFEDAASGIALRNLSLHSAADEEAALNLVSRGVQSSRAHCMRAERDAPVLFIYSCVRGSC